MAIRLGGSDLVMAARTKESKCLNCKKIFLHTDEHVYHGCCSWSCLCRYREKRGTKKACDGRKRVVVETEAQALARIKECKERIAHYNEVLENDALSKKDRKMKFGLRWSWGEKLKDAIAILEEIRRENEQSCDA